MTEIPAIHEAFKDAESWKSTITSIESVTKRLAGIFRDSLRLRVHGSPGTSAADLPNLKAFELIRANCAEAHDELIRLLLYVSDPPKDKIPDATTLQMGKSCASRVGPILVGQWWEVYALNVQGWIKEGRFVEHALKPIKLLDAVAKYEAHGLESGTAETAPAASGSYL